jgi:response regulator RpfG family c-di-GMP phosphodiesterase
MDENGNNTLKNISAVLSEKGYKVKSVSQKGRGANSGFNGEYDLVLMDVNVLRDRGVKPSNIMHEHDPDSDLLLISTQAGRDKRQKEVDNTLLTKKIDNDRLRNIIKNIDFESIRREREKDATIEKQADYEEYLWLKKVFSVHRRAKLRKKLRENIILIVLCIISGVFAVLIGTNIHKIVPGSNYFSKQIDRLITAVEKDWGR